jgi:hypothetical protein
MMIPTGFEESVNVRRIPCECLVVSYFGLSNTVYGVVAADNIIPIHYPARKPSIGINKEKPPFLEVLK